jgi:hypothetical protein
MVPMPGKERLYSPPDTVKIAVAVVNQDFIQPLPYIILWCIDIKGSLPERFTEHPPAVKPKVDDDNIR